MGGDLKEYSMTSERKSRKGNKGMLGTVRILELDFKVI